MSTLLVIADLHSLISSAQNDLIFSLSPSSSPKEYESYILIINKT